MICSKIVNFDRTEAGLTSKWGRISPAVQWCYQIQYNCTVRRRTTSRDVAKKYDTETDTLAAMGQNNLYSKVALAKKSKLITQEPSLVILFVTLYNCKLRLSGFLLPELYGLLISKNKNRITCFVIEKLCLINYQRFMLL